MESLPPGGAEVDIAVLFADVRGSTSLAERMGPAEYAALLNRFYRVATAVLIAQEAVIDKMIGDEVMALFIPGFCGPEYRRRAAFAGDALLRALGYGADTAPWLAVGVGIHAGLAFVGNVGGAGVTDFTALGDTVNTAARLQAEAAAGEVVFSEPVYGAVADRYPGLDTHLVQLRGRDEPLAVRILRLGEAARPPTGQ